ncbi:MAG: NADH-quinone oxidoreductase subunit C, partial [Burkholderiales bacterium]|nr:NADH-quinone oxidoreductase subunit C [Burkholderiales bacterium]
MRIEDFDLELDPIPGAVPAWRGEADAVQWRALCQQVRDTGGRLLALWGSDRRAAERGLAIHAALIVRRGLVWLTHQAADDAYPGIADIFAPANRMQRAVGDLLGIRAGEQRDARHWLRHGAWPDDEFPLRKDFNARTRHVNVADAYPFVRVEGDGVHEIPVGPVHAGTIEPGHFRFSILGERVLRLEERLGYKHKGIEKRFEQMMLAEGARLAGRISGDSTVAYVWAYAMAVEGATGAAAPPRALW